jgi:hypothetical protein
MLQRAGAVETPSAAVTVPPAAPSDLKASVERSVALLEKTSVGFAASGGCASCHAQNITDMTTGVARAHGVQVDAKAARDRQQLTKAPLYSPSNLLERMDGPGAPDIAVYALSALAGASYPPDRTTDAMVAQVIALQCRDGHWAIGTIARPPIEDGNIFRTALAIRALKTYGPPGRSAQIGERLAKATAWLTAAVPITAEDRNMQLLGLRWAGVGNGARQRLAKAILDAQRADGGWAQTAELNSDAYATGQSLYALAEGAGMTTAEPDYRKGVRYLLSTQRADGSWHVRSRAPKFQPFFESGFPYGHDQWISSMATGWAATALALAMN